MQFTGNLSRITMQIVSKHTSAHLGGQTAFELDRSKFKINLSASRLAANNYVIMCGEVIKVFEADYRFFDSRFRQCLLFVYRISLLELIKSSWQIGGCVVRLLA